MKPRPEKPTDFDSYAAEYTTLVRDPIREKFASSNRFFFERKLHVIRDFYRRRGTDLRTQHWLDVGCGQGDLLRLGQSEFASAYGCDPSAGMLDSCRDLQVRQQHTVDSLPFEDHSFDLITAVCVYHHVREHQRLQFTKEVLRVLKHGGVFCVIEHNPLNPVTRLIVSRTPIDADAQLLTATRTRHVLSAAGSEILETRYFLLLPERIYGYVGFIENALGRLPLAGQYSVFAKAPE